MTWCSCPSTVSVMLWHCYAEAYLFLDVTWIEYHHHNEHFCSHHVYTMLVASVLWLSDTNYDDDACNILHIYLFVYSVYALHHFNNKKRISWTPTHCWPTSAVTSDFVSTCTLVLFIHLLSLMVCYESWFRFSSAPLHNHCTPNVKIHCVIIITSRNDDDDDDDDQRRVWMRLCICYLLASYHKIIANANRF